jgi:hypothetical protein
MAWAMKIKQYMFLLARTCDREVFTWSIHHILTHCSLKKCVSMNNSFGLAATGNGDASVSTVSRNTEQDGRAA